MSSLTQRSEARLQDIWSRDFFELVGFLNDNSANRRRFSSSNMIGQIWERKYSPHLKKTFFFTIIFCCSWHFSHFVMVCHTRGGEPVLNISSCIFAWTSYVWPSFIFCSFSTVSFSVCFWNQLSFYLSLVLSLKKFDLFVDFCFLNCAYSNSKMQRT